MKILKKIAVSLFALLSLSNNVHSAEIGVPRPYIQYEEHGLRVFDNTDNLAHKYSYLITRYHHTRSFYYSDRGLGLTKEDITNHFIKQNEKYPYSSPVIIKERNIKKGLKLVSLTDLIGRESLFASPIYKGYYVLRDNLGIAYCLLDPLITSNYLPKTLSTDSVYNNIKSLPVNTKYLHNKIKLPPNTSITFYEKKHDGFIERYGIARTMNYEIVLLESFYPTELEEVFEDKIIKILNINLKMFYYNDYASSNKNGDLPSGVDASDLPISPIDTTEDNDDEKENEKDHKDRNDK